MSRPTRETVEGRAYLDLKNLARAQRRPNAELQQLYALEGFLSRLVLSDFAERLILKGGVLLAAFGTRRPTRDVDLQAVDVSNELAVVLDLVRHIAAIPAADGLVFDVAGARADVIRDGADYSGVRVSMSATLSRTHLTFHVDVNVGDPVWPAPDRVSVPRLLGGDAIELPGYPLHMVYAEKLVTAADRGTANTRWRDFGDIWTLSGRHSVGGSQLQTAIGEVARHRNTPLEPLAEALDGYPDLAQDRWQRWRQKQQADHLPVEFERVLARVISFGDPAFKGQVGSAAWAPVESVWLPI